MPTIARNGDTGSLHIGTCDARVGDEIQLEGEPRRRRISYLMGSGPSQHAACKGFGPFPLGAVRWALWRDGVERIPFGPPMGGKTEGGKKPPPDDLFPNISAMRTGGIDLRRPIVAMGLDVGVDERKPTSGLVTVRHVPGEPLELLHAPIGVVRGNALKTALRLSERFAVDYVVIDGPILSDATARPPAGHVYGDGRTAFFRPHEKLIAAPARRALGGMADEPGLWGFCNRIQAMSTWSDEKEALSSFAEQANALARGLHEERGLAFVDRFDVLRPRGVLEGFPKATYLPLVPMSAPLERWADTAIVLKNTVDEAVLRWLFDTAAPERFWGRFDLEVPQDESAEHLEAAFADPDLTCALAMALQGVLYGRGRALAMTSRMRDGSFDFGHFLSVEAAAFEPWARVWLADRLAFAAQSLPRAEVSLFGSQS